MLGPEHPDTLTARAGLAIHAGKAGDAAGARDQLAALLPIRERVKANDRVEMRLPRSLVRPGEPT